MSDVLRSVLATNSLAPTYNRSLDIIAVYVLVVLLVVRFLEVRHVYNDQMDSVFSDCCVRTCSSARREIFGSPSRLQ